MKKSIFLFFAAILCAMSVSANMVYLKPNGDWSSSNAKFYVWSWGGSKDLGGLMTYVGLGLYGYEIGNNKTCHFTRNDPKSTGLWDSEWNRIADQTINTTKPCCKVTGWSSGTWIAVPSAYIAGATELTGSNWSANAAANKMTKQSDGTWTLTKNIEIAKGDYEYKVTDGSWDWSFGEGSNNKNINIPATGKYEVTFTYTPSPEKVSATATPIYSVTVNAGEGGNATGSGECKNGEYVTIDATPETNYEFVNWTIVNGTGSFESNTTASTKFYATSDATIQANFRSTLTYSLTTSFGEGIASVTGATNPVALGESYAISATPKTGYAFKTWTADPAANAEFETATNANTNVKVLNGSVDVIASATEILSILTTANSYNVGTPDAAAPAISTNQIGVATHATVAAESISGYTLAGWTLTNCERVDGGAENATTITVKSTGTDAAATVTANYEINKYYVVGSFNGWTTKDVNYEMTYDNGVYKKEVTFAKDVEFKICNGSWAASWSYDNLQGIEYKELVKSDDKDKNIKLTKDATFTIVFDLSKHLITFEGLTEIVPKYYLVGTFNGWDTADPNYEMTLEGGVYKKEVTFAKDVEFKVCDGTWNNNWGKNNLGGIQYNELTENEDNIKMKEAKTFTVIFNPAENLILFEGLTEKVTYVLMGVNGDWDNGIKLTPNPKKAGEYMLLAQTIAKATDAVKIVKIEDGNKTQYCQFENVKDGSVTCTEGTHKNIVLEDGIYNFYYTTNDNKVYIETSTPAHTRTVPAGYYATVCLPNNIINVVGATLFEVAGKNGDKVIFDEVLTPVAGMPYIFLTEESTISFYCGIETAATPGNHKSLHGTFEDMVDADLDGMYMVQNNKIVKCAATGCNIPANRAYFNGTELESLGSAPAPMPGRRRITMGAESENTATGVEGIIVPEGQTIKVISNGQLIIIHNGEMYNAQGVRL